MKPLHIGFTGEKKQPLTLSPADLETHIHGVGASRTGKSKLIEWIARELIRRGQGMCLIDPHGFLYEDLLAWLAYVEPKREIVLFNPSFADRVVGFNPFQPHAGDLSTQVDRRVQATIKAWGGVSTDQTPRLERWLRCLYYALLEQGHSVEVAYYFLTWNQKEIRDYLIHCIHDRLIQSEWMELAAQTRARDFSDQLESTHNRLFRFIQPQQIRRIVSLAINTIDLEDIIEHGKILLVNLQPSSTVSEENARLLGTLLLNELWEVGMRRKRSSSGNAPPDFFLIIDEFQKFLTPDIPAMLDQSAKFGIHLCLFHQHLAQLKVLDEQAYGAVMTNARTKFVFGGLSREDARTMVEEIFPGQIDLKQIKFIIEQTKFWPTYRRDKIYTSGSGSGSSNYSTSGESWNPALDQWVPSSAGGQGTLSSYQEGEADIPIFYPEPFKEVSSITPYSLDELLWQLSDRLMDQYARHFMVRRPGQPTTAAVTPFVKPFSVTPERLHTYTLKLLSSFLTPEAIDQKLLEIHTELRAKAVLPPHELNPEDVWEQ